MAGLRAEKERLPRVDVAGRVALHARGQRAEHARARHEAAGREEAVGGFLEIPREIGVGRIRRALAAFVGFVDVCAVGPCGHAVVEVAPAVVGLACTGADLGQAGIVIENPRHELVVVVCAGNRIRIRRGLRAGLVAEAEEKMAARGGDEDVDEAECRVPFGGAGLHKFRGADFRFSRDEPEVAVLGHDRSHHILGAEKSAGLEARRAAVRPAARSVRVFRVGRVRSLAGAGIALRKRPPERRVGRTASAIGGGAAADEFRDGKFSAGEIQIECLDEVALDRELHLDRTAGEIHRLCAGGDLHAGRGLAHVFVAAAAERLHGAAQSAGAAVLAAIVVPAGADPVIQRRLAGDHLQILPVDRERRLEGDLVFEVFRHFVKAEARAERRKEERRINRALAVLQCRIARVHRAVLAVLRADEVEAELRDRVIAPEALRGADLDRCDLAVVRVARPALRDEHGIAQVHAADVVEDLREHLIAIIAPLFQKISAIARQRLRGERLEVLVERLVARDVVVVRLRVRGVLTLEIKWHRGLRGAVRPDGSAERGERIERRARRRCRTRRPHADARRAEERDLRRTAVCSEEKARTLQLLAELRQRGF